MPLIEVKDLYKQFVVYKRGKGLGSFVKDMVSPDKKIVKAVDGINFNIDKGEIVESGNHAELMEQKGSYFNLYKAQYQFLLEN